MVDINRRIIEWGLQEKWSGDCGIYYLDRRISERIGKLIWVKIFKEDVVGNALLESRIKHQTHKLIQEKIKQRLLPHWFASADIIWNSTRAWRRWYIYQEHVPNAISALDFMESENRNGFKMEVPLFLLAKYIKECMLNLGVHVWCDLVRNLMFDETAQRDLVIFSKTLGMDMDYYGDCYKNFTTAWKIYINIDVGQWSISPRTQTPLSSH